VSDDEPRFVAEFLERPQLAEDDRVAEMDVGRRRVQPELDAQRAARGPAALELASQLRRLDEVHGPLGEVREVLVHPAGPRGRRAPCGSGGRAPVSLGGGRPPGSEAGPGGARGRSWKPRNYSTPSSFRLANPRALRMPGS